jgi:hypothetical protein
MSDETLHEKFRPPCSMEIESISSIEESPQLSVSCSADALMMRLASCKASPESPRPQHNQEDDHVAETDRVDADHALSPAANDLLKTRVRSSFLRARSNGLIVELESEGKEEEMRGRRKGGG